MIDVESLGLHGPGFAVGYCWADFAGRIYEEGIWAVRPDSLRVDDIEGAKWVAENVKIESTDYNCTDLCVVYDKFWRYWLKIHKTTLMFADVPWPVEARFLNACVDVWPAGHNWEGPYPLLDSCAFRLAHGHRAMGKEHRLEDELPEHNPLADARQSLRLLCELIQSKSYIEEVLREG
jgi:hypothetical protein